MKSHNLSIEINDCTSVGEVVNRALNLLYRVGLKKQAAELKERIKKAGKTEEYYEIIDDYVELI